MSDRLDELLAKLSGLKQDVLIGIQAKQKQFGFSLNERRVRFTAAITAQNKKLAKNLSQLRPSRIFIVLTAPVIWSVLLPVLLLDLALSFYQFVCFPVYGIPKVRRADFIVLDRRKLGYLSMLERLNCVYCEYVNGFLAYATEIAGRTEQYWCPIKHAMRLKAAHSRYQKFLDYGDAEVYRAHLKEVAEDFDDLKKDDPQ